MGLRTGWLLAWGLAAAPLMAQEGAPPAAAPMREGEAPAEPAATPALTLEQAVELALRQHPQAAAAAADVAAARFAAASARARVNPELTVAPGLTGASGADEELSFSQPLEINGTRRARAGRAAADQRVVQAEAATVRRNLVREVKLAYYDLARARQLRALQEESVGLAEAFEQAARRQVEAGTRAGIEATQLAVETTRARQLLLQAETAERLAAARLNTALGRPPEEPLPALEPLTYELGNWETGKLGNWAAKQGKLGNWAAKQGKPGRVTEFPNFLISQFPDSPISRRTEVVAEAERWQALRQEVQLIRAEGRPDLAVQARMETFTERPRVGGLSVAVSLPLFDWGARRNRRRAAEQAADAQAARVEATANQVRLEVAQAQARVQLAEGLLQQYQAGVLEQAKRLADGAQKQLQAGVVSVLAVLEAQRTYRSVLADYTTALADLAQARAELEWALGLGDPAAR